MKKIWRLALTALFVIALRDVAKAQWLNGGTGGFQYLTNPTNGVRVGNTNTAPPSALTVFGNEMTPNTGEVFRTDAPNGSTTSWRLLRGGTERGRLFSLSTDDHFHLDAPNGDMRFWTNNLLRVRINRTLTGQTVTNGAVGIGMVENVLALHS